MKELWTGWETVEPIGTGGFSKVYKIRKNDSSDNGEYYAALKIISIPQSPDEYETYALEGFDDNTITGIFTSQVKKIVEEFRLMAQFKGNSNIVSYEDHMIVPHEDGKGWDILIRMELLTSLPKYCTQNVLSEEETVKLGIDICRALELCQKKNIIHRDIKPQNIFVNEFGDYKLGDFGIAKSMDHTTHATKTGTYTYMAPEVYRGEAYNATIDIYSLGLVLYWLLNERRLPFLPLPPDAPTASQLNESQVRRFSGEALPAPKNGSDKLKAIVLKACAFNASDRYLTPTAMRRELERELSAIVALFEETVRSDDQSAWENTVPLSGAGEATQSLFFTIPPSAVKSEDADKTVPPQNRPIERPYAGEPVPADAPDNVSDATVSLFGDRKVPDETVGLFGDRTAPPRKTPAPEFAPEFVPDPAPEFEPMTEPAPMPEAEAPTEEKKSGKGKLFAIIGGAVVVLIIILLFLLRGCGDTTDSGEDGESGEYGNKNEIHSVHTYDSWITTEVATCTVSGTQKRTCTTCGYAETKTIVATGHTLGNDAAVAATCTKSGLTAGKHCSVCGTVTVKQTTVAATGKHTYVSGKCSSCGVTAKPETPVQDTSALTSLMNGCINSFVTDVATEGIELWEDEDEPWGGTGLGEDEVAECLFDGDTSTSKMVGLYSSAATITWKTTVQTTVNAYVIYTGFDSAYWGRTPLSWIFYGSNNGINWIAIDTVNNSGMYDADSMPFGYYVDNPKAYTYYKLEVTSTTEDNGFWEKAIQMNELILIGDKAHSYVNGQCSKCGMAKPVGVGLEYELQSDGTYAVTGIGSCTDTDVIIPATYNGTAVTRIENSAFRECSSLTSITIPNSVTSIGKSAFEFCSSLTSITIPNSVTSIENWSFMECSSLISIAIPNSVTSIGEAAFWGCSRLSSITIPNSVTSIGMQAFVNCSSLTSVTISNSVTSIGGFAFGGCTSLTSVTIPDSVASIGYGAFEYCSKLTSVTFQDPSGWYVTETEGATSGVDVTVSDAAIAATFLRDTYSGYYWYRK